jgi:hypothetical protein
MSLRRDRPAVPLVGPGLVAGDESAVRDAGHLGARAIYPAVVHDFLSAGDRGFQSGGLVPLGVLVHRTSPVRQSARRRWQPQAVLQKAVCSPDLWLVAEPVHFRAAPMAPQDELVSQPPLVRRALQRRAHW